MVSRRGRFAGAMRSNSCIPSQGERKASDGANGGEQKTPRRAADGREAHQVAPMAARTASSRSRRDARTRRRLATLAQAISKRKDHRSHKCEDSGPNFRDKMLANGLDADCVACGAFDDEVLARFCSDVISSGLRAFVTRRHLLICRAREWKRSFDWRCRSRGDWRSTLPGQVSTFAEDGKYN